jgi:hypothetical protein
MSAELLEQTDPKPHPVEIVVNGHPVMMPDLDTTGAQIRTLGQVPAEEILFEILGGGHEKRIDDTDVVHLHEGMVFESSPDGGVS